MKTWQKVVLSIVLVVIIGGAALGVTGYHFIKKMINRIENSTLIVEDLQNGTKQAALPFKTSFFCTFTQDSEKIMGTVRGDSLTAVVLYTIETKEVDTLFTSEKKITPLKMSATDSGVYYFREDEGKNQLYLYHRNNKTHQKVSSLNHIESSHAALSPDEKFLSYTKMGSSGRTELFVMNLQTSEEFEMTKTKSLLGEIQNKPIWIDSKRIAFVSFTLLQILDISTGRIEQSIPLKGLNNFNGLFSSHNEPNTLYIKARKATGGFSFSIYKVSLINGTIKRWRKGVSIFEMDHRISPDGTKLLYVGSPE